MPAKKKTRADRVAECFGELYRDGKARADLTEDEITTLIGFKTRDTLLKRRKNPLDLTIGQLMAMGIAFRWKDDEYLSLLQAIVGRPLRTGHGSADTAQLLQDLAKAIREGGAAS